MKIQSISKHFGKTQALDRVTCSFETGTITGLLGRNGAGKSTLMHICSNRLVPDSGTVTFDGLPVLEKQDQLQKLFMVDQTPLMPLDLKISQAFKAAGQVYPGFDPDLAHEIAGRFKLNSKQRLAGLSTGMRTLFQMSLALASNAQVLLLDEPILGLDVSNRDLFYRILIERYNDYQPTIILSTHLIEEVAHLIENAVILEKGRVLYSGPIQELVDSVIQVRGPADQIETWSKSQDVLYSQSLGGLKSVTVKDPEFIPDHFEACRLDLQEVFIGLTGYKPTKGDPS